jgi:hypothetical protein
MSVRRLQGSALIISAVINLVGLMAPGSPPVRFLFIVGAVLLIFGVPAIQSVQPEGTLGWIGIVLIELAAVIALVVNINALAGGADLGAVPLVSAIAGAIGEVIVGWLTSRRSIFPQWAGWAFIVHGVLNLAGGLFGGGFVLGIIVALVGAAALFAYGWGITQHSR